MGVISPNKAAASCVGCFGWGVLPGRYCRACYSFNQTHGVGKCAACDRVITLKNDYCRLCWMQASLEAHGQVTVLEPFLRRVRHHQLSLADMQRWGARRPGQRLGKRGRRIYQTKTKLLQPNPSFSDSEVQLILPIQTRRDYRRFDRRRDADFTNPALIRARAAATAIGESRGWTHHVTSDVDRALVILLSGHVIGEAIRYSELFPELRRHGLSVERTIEVLIAIGVFNDDRVPVFEAWLQRKLADLPPGFRHGVEHWLRTLREGSPRSQPRNPSTPVSYLLQIQSALAVWSQRYDHLREVTVDDILEVAETLHGSERHHMLSVLRSLFRHCKKTGIIFRDPAARIRVGDTPRKIMLPLDPNEIKQSITAATTPAARLVLALAAIHAARPKAIRELRLDDIDLGNRRLTIAGRARPLDDLTRTMILEWLDHRRTRWPDTANPHLIINQQTAMETVPVSNAHLTDAFRGQTATLERLRVHRQLDEALTIGPDPLHLAAVFGLDPKTAIRYADNARHLLITEAERHTPRVAANPRVETDQKSRNSMSSS
jgi:site-specific recombinase XerD